MKVIPLPPPGVCHGGPVRRHRELPVGGDAGHSQQAVHLGVGRVHSRGHHEGGVRLGGVPPPKPGGVIMFRPEEGPGVP